MGDRNWRRVALWAAAGAVLALLLTREDRTVDQQPQPNLPDRPKGVTDEAWARWLRQVEELRRQGEKGTPPLPTPPDEPRRPLLSISPEYYTDELPKPGPRKERPRVPNPLLLPPPRRNAGNQIGPGD
jgi:hypothetical protein